MINIQSEFLIKILGCKKLKLIKYKLKKYTDESVISNLSVVV